MVREAGGSESRAFWEVGGSNALRLVRVGKYYGLELQKFGCLEEIF